eukprot:scaffold116712_cov37-Phaeocystis_antarctica.AAC.1
MDPTPNPNPHPNYTLASPKPPTLIRRETSSRSASRRPDSACASRSLPRFSGIAGRWRLGPGIARRSPRRREMAWRWLLRRRCRRHRRRRCESPTTCVTGSNPSPTNSNPKPHPHQVPNYVPDWFQP